jgi:hypothetical protein
MRRSPDAAHATPGILIALARDVAGDLHVGVQVGVQRLLFDPAEARALGQAIVTAADELDAVLAGRISLDPSRWQSGSEPIVPPKDH